MFKKFLFVSVVLLAVLVASCGPKQPSLITKSAAEINFSAEDLGANFTNIEDVDKEGVLEGMEISEENKALLDDASFRSFVDTQTSVLVTSLVFRYKTADAAASFLEENWAKVMEGVKEEIQENQLEELSHSGLGDDLKFVKASFPDQGFNAYLVGMRKVNVVTLASFVGGESDLKEQDVVELLEGMLDRMK